MVERNPRAEAQGERREERGRGSRKPSPFDGTGETSETDGPDHGEAIVSKALLSGVFSECAEEIEALEGALAEEIPGGSPQGIHRSLEAVAEGLSSGARTMRTHPSINVYARLTDAPIGADLMRALVAFDAKVNAVDDVIDTEGLDQRERTHLMTVVGFSDLFVLEQLPPEHVPAVAAILRRYAVELAQIPSVEHRMRERIRSAATRQGRLDAVTSIYAYRARDMKAFAEIPAVVSELDPGVVERTVGDLCAFRARYLLFEDFRHVERDRSAGHENPIMVLAGAGASADEISGTVHELLSHFSYSAWSGGRYASVLQNLERRPRNLDEAIADAFEALVH